MSIEVRHDPAPGRHPWAIVTTIGGTEVEQERHPTEAAANAAVPEIRRALRGAYRL